MVRAIHWFRYDLRLADNPALQQACQSSAVLALYIYDDVNIRKLGGATKVWLHHALISLSRSLNGKLAVYRGDPEVILPKLLAKYQIDAITWNRYYEPQIISRDTKLKQSLSSLVDVSTHNGHLLWEPWQICKADNTPYGVFTPFYRKGCLGEGANQPRKPIAKPDNLQLITADDGLAIEDLQLLPQHHWGQKISKNWDISEDGAHNTLASFISNGLENYKEGRNFPANNNTSVLSPYLHMGQISPNQVWYQALAAKNADNIKDVEHFCSELGWREFSYNLLYHFPDLPHKNLQNKFDKFPWLDHDNDEALRRWQRGLTGYPIVDAGMRQLWHTGYMHNRLRMIVGSFLVKNLLIHWHHGEQWFWDCLFDADLANNSASWQWVAGCGADAAPYFRIFNPITQGEKFDSQGIFTRQYVPELQNLADKYLFKPWEAPAEILEAAGLRLVPYEKYMLNPADDCYPLPMVDVSSSRKRALVAFDQLKATNT
jgi:deoxyribodipyrimidine photo-lyase